MSNLFHDLRYAFRALRRAPVFATAAVLTIALGIGSSTAIYAALERVVLDPLPYPDSGRLVRLRSDVPGVGPDTEWDVSAGAWFYFGRQAQAIETMGAYRRFGATVVGPDGPKRVRAAQVTAGTLRMLGARAVVGRTIGETDDDPGTPLVAMLSYGYWQREFGGDTTVIGTAIRPDEQTFEVIGVLAPSFELPPTAGVPSAEERTDIWLPLRLNPAGPFYNAHTQFRTIARLRAGSTVEAAQRELDRLTARLPEVLPTVYPPEFMERYGFATHVYPLKAYVVGGVAKSLWILFGAVGLVLLIAYANVANLFLVRAEGRRQEIDVRTALGAGFGAVARHFLAEGIVLAVAGGLLGLVLAYWGTDWLGALAPDGIPRLDGVRPDGSVIAFAAGLAAVVAVVLSIVPALRARRAIRAGVLSDGGRRTTVGRERKRTRSGLVIAQVALALVLIVGAGLLVESLIGLRGVDPGIRPDGVVTAQVYLPYTRYDSIPKMWRFYEAMLDRVRAVPGVAVAGLSQDLPLAGGFGCTVQGFEDPEVRRRVAESNGTLCAGQELNSPGYFAAMGIPVLQGRALTRADFDHPERGAVVVSKAFAERFWPNEDPIGKGVGPSGRTNQQFYRVVGMVGDVYGSSLADDPAIAIYYPIQTIPGTYSSWPNPVTLVVRAAGTEPVSLVPAIQRAVWSIDPTIPLADVQEMRSVVDRSLASLSFMMVLLATAAATALLLAAVGLYGVVSYVVTRRTAEIGVRVALGARASHVTRLVVGGSMRLALIGTAVGVITALVASRVLASLLYGVETTEPTVYVLAAVVLGGVAALAAYLPARRATRIDPVEALRHE